MSRRLVALGVLGLVAALATVGAYLASASASQRPLTFVDDRNGQSFTVQIDAAASDFGHLVFRVPSLGIYVAEVASALRTETPTSSVLNYAGPAALGPALNASGVVTGTVSTTSTVEIRLHAQIDPAHHTAVATLSEGQRPFAVVATPTKGDTGAILRSIETAVVSADWAALYPLMSGDVTSRYTSTTFAQLMDAQRATTNRITALRRSSVTAPATTDQGLTFVVATYSADFETPGRTTGTQLFDVFLVDDSGSWRVAFTRAH